MNSISIVIYIALIFVNLTTSKPIKQMDLELKTLETESQYSNQIHSIVKRLTGADSSSNTGHASIIPSIIITEGTKEHKKKRHCEKWIKIPIINQYKCSKFKVLPNNTGHIKFTNSAILGLLEEVHPYKEQVVNRHKIKESSQLPTYN